MRGTQLHRKTGDPVVLESTDQVGPRVGLHVADHHRAFPERVHFGEARRLNLQQHVGCAKDSGRIAKLDIRIQSVRKMGRHPCAAFDQHANAGGAQFGGDFRDHGDTSFCRLGFPQDTDDDGHADLSKTLSSC